MARSLTDQVNGSAPASTSGEVEEHKWDESANVVEQLLSLTCSDVIGTQQRKAVQQWLQVFDVMSEVPEGAGSDTEQQESTHVSGQVCIVEMSTEKELKARRSSPEVPQKTARPRSPSGSGQDTRKRQKFDADQYEHAEWMQGVHDDKDKGSRLTMEDSTVVLMDARLDPLWKQRVSFFGVFDGHGGCNAAKMASASLHMHVMNAGLVPTEVAAGTKDMTLKGMVKVLVEGFHNADQEILEESEANKWVDGCAAVGVWAVGEKIIVANVGDAKCVLARISSKEGSKGQLKGLVLTKEHLAIYPKERARILKCGGYVSSDGRLDGRLQVSRSLGDRQLKNSGLIATPDVQGFTITDSDRFMICGCDGFWKVFDSQDVVSVTSKLLDEGRDLKSVTNRLINMAVRERRCTDNCTVMLIKFLHQQPPDTEVDESNKKKEEDG